MTSLGLLLLLVADPVLFYSKSFPGSSPAYVSITLTRDGEAIYKEAPDDETPAKLKLAKEEVDEMYALAEKLEHFKRPLESGLKVAFMGEKTFGWHVDESKQEQKFNYSQDAEANKLLDWFEKITLSEVLFFQLQRTVRYDKLGVHKWKPPTTASASWDSISSCPCSTVSRRTPVT
jgi:hypothetical protein